MFLFPVLLAIGITLSLAWPCAVPCRSVSAWGVRVCVCVSVRIQVLRQNPGRMLTHLVRTIGRRGVGKGFVCLCVLHACVCVRVVVNLSHCENVNPGDFQYPLGICINRG